MFLFQGTVAFGSGLHCWAFTLVRFARMYAKKFGVDEEKMMNRLWGDSFFDAKAKKWTKTPEGADGDRLKRAFCQFVWEPINQMFDAVMSDKVEKYTKMLTSLGIKLTTDDKGDRLNHSSFCYFLIPHRQETAEVHHAEVAASC